MPDIIHFLIILWSMLTWNPIQLPSHTHINIELCRVQPHGQCSERILQSVLDDSSCIGITFKKLQTNFFINDIIKQYKYKRQRLMAMSL